MIKELFGDAGLPEFKFNKALDITAGDLLSKIIELVSFLAVFLAFIWVAVAAVQWIFSSGDKEKLALARKRITYAFVGLIIILLAFLVMNFAKAVLKPKEVPVVPINFVTPAYAAETPLENIYGFGDLNDLGEGISRFVAPIFSVATTGIVFYLILAGFKYLTSGGNKDELAKARNMVTQALIGFVVLIFTFIIFQFFFSSLFGVTFKIVN